MLSSAVKIMLRTYFYFNDVILATVDVTMGWIHAFGNRTARCCLTTYHNSVKEFAKHCLSFEGYPQENENHFVDFSL